MHSSAGISAITSKRENWSLTAIHRNVTKCKHRVTFASLPAPRGASSKFNNAASGSSMVSPPVLSELVSNPSGLVPLLPFRQRHLCPPGPLADSYPVPHIPGAAVPLGPTCHACRYPARLTVTGVQAGWVVPLLKDLGTQRKGDTGADQPVLASLGMYSSFPASLPQQLPPSRACCRQRSSC